MEETAALIRVLLVDDHPVVREGLAVTYDGDEDIYRGLQAGAKAYLLKDTPRAELLDTIRAVHAGQKRIPVGIIDRGRLLALADKRSIPLRDLHIQQPSLEDIFLHLTGRTIQEK